MKITVDTKAKTIQLHENITILELVEELDKLGIGEDYKIIAEQAINYIPYPYYPSIPYQQPFTWGTYSGDLTITNKEPESVTLTYNYNGYNTNK